MRTGQIALVIAGLALAAGLVLSFAPDPIGLVAGPVLGVALGMHFLVGLAVVHMLSRGSAARPILLAATWGLAFLLTFPALIVVAIGVVEHFARFRDRRRGVPPARS